MRFFVYKVDCHASGQSYIGVTTNLKNRLAGHRYRGWLPLDEGCNDYIIACCWDRNAAGRLEAQKILEYDTLYPNGHNQVYGGFDGRQYPQRVRDMLSAAAKGRPGSFTGRKHSEVTKQKMRAAKRYSSEENKKRLRTLRLGQKLSEETRLKMRESRSEEDRARSAKRGWETRRANAAAQLPPPPAPASP